MKEVIITQGAYGHRAEGSSFVKTVAKGEHCIVSDNEAERLVKLGVAKVVDTKKVEVAPVIEEPIFEEAEEKEFDLASMKFDELKALAIDMGIDNVGKLNSKQKLIDAIKSFEDEEAPELAAEGLVE